MEYSGDILARVRAALLEYHAATHTSGRKRTWSAIAGDLSDYLPETDFDDDSSLSSDPFKPLAEALRRFAADTQTPSRQRLDALCAFLKQKSFLTQSDLNPAEAGSPLAYALRLFFGEAEKPAGDIIGGLFSATRKLPSGRTEVSVLTIRSSETSVPAAEDKIYSLPIAPQSMRRDALARVLNRSGGSEKRFDGWLFHGKGQTCLVVQDTLRGDPSIYTVLDRKVPSGTTPARMVLIKSRDFGAPPAGAAGPAMRIVEDESPQEAAFNKIKGRLWEYRREERHGD